MDCDRADLHTVAAAVASGLIPENLSCGKGNGLPRTLFRADTAAYASFSNNDNIDPRGLACRMVFTEGRPKVHGQKRMPALHYDRFR
jgi:hypothetical protein